LERNYLKGRHGDRINAVLAAAGYNFSLLLAAFIAANPAMAELMYAAHSRLKSKFFTGDA
jgi:hypothetical protein